jgi:hypothetical protein
MGDHVWLMTSKHTEPDLYPHQLDFPKSALPVKTNPSSMLGWKILLTKPIDGDLYGYWSGSSTWTFHLPSAKGAVDRDPSSADHASIISSGSRWNQALTLCRAFKDDVELLHIVVDQSHLIVAHHELHDICLYPPLGAAHRVSPDVCAFWQDRIERGMLLRVHSLGRCVGASERKWLCRQDSDELRRVGGGSEGGHETKWDVRAESDEQTGRDRPLFTRTSEAVRSDGRTTVRGSEVKVRRV